MEKIKNREWRINNLFWIKNKQGIRIKFRLNWCQKILFDNLWFLNVILKVRQLGVCLDPKTKVLTSDLKWVNIGDLKIGTELISVDENTISRGKGRRMKTGIVQGVVSVYREAYKITFDDGRVVICTAQHPWLSRKVNTDYAWRNIEGIGNGNKKAKLTVGTKIRSITKPWDNSQSYEDGWISGMMDGEGSFSKKSRLGAQVCIAQVAGDVLDRVKEYFNQRKYNYRIEIDKRKAGEKSKLGNKYVYRIVVGRMNELFRLCGKTRPSRFIKNEWWQGKEMPTHESCNKIVKIEKLGRRRMIDLQTSAGTYIAEGFVSHNTTFFCIVYLDDCIFNGMDAGLIAHTYKDAKKIFDSKVKYAWDNLSDALKEGIKVDTDSAQELKFTRGNVTSSIYVGTSLRSGTVQRLHLSETATIDQKYPAKSEEIKSGALNTVTEGQIVTMESTSKGPTGIFHDICLQAMDNKKKGDLTEMDWRFFFFAWWKHPQYELEGDIVIPNELDEYFNKLEINEGIKISKPKRNWYFKKLGTQKDSMKSEYPSTPEEAFLQSIEGAYYGKEMDKVLESGRITSVPYNPLLLVDTWWDLGTSKVKKDATSIIFTQDIGLEIHIIDFYGNSGEGLPHYIRVLQNKGYIYGRHNAPHDIAVKELGTGKTRREAAAGLGLHFEVVPNIGFIDGVDMARVVLSKCYFDEKKTTRLVRALRTYRKEWDENLGKFKDNPLQDSSADPADSFRMLAVGHKDIVQLGEYDEEEEELMRIKDNEANEQSIDPFNPF